MNFELKLTKTDLITIVLLSVLFFSIAAYNVGATDYATSCWETTSNASFYVDLGSSQQVQTVVFFVRQGNATVNIASGTPDNWNTLGDKNLEDDDRDFYKFFTFSTSVETRYLQFNITATEYDARPQFYWSVPNPTDETPSPYVCITEIGLINQNNEQVIIEGITSINGTDSSLTNLADEQSSLELPPSYMSKMYFDEIYFARSAIEFVNHQMPIERTHPPLGKLIQAIGVAAFGETPFGWRIMGVIFGTLMVPLMYLIGKKLFGTWIGGFSAGFLFSFDFMHFTMARIGTVDTYMIFFTLLSQFLFLIYFARVLKNGWKTTSVLPLILAVVAFSCAFATKFGFPLFSALGLISLLVALRLKEVVNLKATLGEKYVAFFDKPAMLLIACTGIVAAIYFASYIPEMLMGNSPMQILDLQNSMFGFHSGTVTDSSSSPWWSWPFMLRIDGASVPRWFDITRGLPGDTVSTITVFGNPAIWWIGFGAMVALALHAFKVPQLITSLQNKSSIKAVLHNWDISALFIVVVFGFAWLPYVFIGRAAYIYHFYSAVPMLCLALSYFINKYWSKPLGKVMAIAVFAASVGLFLYFYPVISGAPATTEQIQSLIWFKSWGFLG